MIAQRGGRQVFVSPWAPVVLLLTWTFAVIGIVIAAWDTSTASRVIGVLMCVATVPAGIALFLTRVTVLDEVGFRVFPHRKVSWETVLWAEVQEIPASIFPNFAIAIVSRTKGPDGYHLQYTLGGTASFFSEGRLTRHADVLNDWIAAANPGEVINPWLHKSSRPDNR